MTNSFVQQIEKATFDQGSVPSRALVDGVIGSNDLGSLSRPVGPTLLGALCGLLIGLLFKGSFFGMPAVLGGFGMFCLAMSLPLAIGSACVARRHPVLFQFASINLLTALVTVLS